MSKFFSLDDKITSFGDKFNYGTDSDGDCCCADPSPGEEVDLNPSFMPGWLVSASLGSGSYKFKLPIRAKKDGAYYGNKFRGWLACSFSRGNSNWASKITLPEGKTAYATTPTSFEMFTSEELAIPEGEPGHVEEWPWYGTYWCSNMGTPDFAYRETVGYLETDKDWGECYYPLEDLQTPGETVTSLGYYYATSPSACAATGGSPRTSSYECKYSDNFCEWFARVDPEGIGTEIFGNLFANPENILNCHGTDYCCRDCTEPAEVACREPLLQCLDVCGGDAACETDCRDNFEAAEEACLDNICLHPGDFGAGECPNLLSYGGTWVPGGGVPHDFDGRAVATKWLECKIAEDEMDGVATEWEGRGEESFLCECNMNPDWEVFIFNACDEIRGCTSAYNDTSDECTAEMIDCKGNIPGQGGCADLWVDPYGGTAYEECVADCIDVNYECQVAARDTKDACLIGCQIWDFKLLAMEDWLQGNGGTFANRNSRLFYQDAYQKNSTRQGEPGHCTGYSCEQLVQDPDQPFPGNVYGSFHGCSGNIINNTSMGFRALSGGAGGVMLLFTEDGVDDVYTSASDCSYSLTGRAEGFEGISGSQWMCDGCTLDALSCCPNIGGPWLYGNMSGGDSIGHPTRPTCDGCTEALWNKQHDYVNWEDGKGHSFHAQGLRAFFPMAYDNHAWYGVPRTSYHGFDEEHDQLNCEPEEGATHGFGGTFYEPATAGATIGPFPDKHSDRLCYCKGQISGGRKVGSTFQWQTDPIGCRDPSALKQFAEEAKSYVSGGGGAESPPSWPSLDARPFYAPTNLNTCGGRAGEDNVLDAILCDDYKEEEVDAPWAPEGEGGQPGYRNWRRGVSGSPGYNGNYFYSVFGKGDGHWYMDHPGRKTEGGCDQSYLDENYWHPHLYDWGHYDWDLANEDSTGELRPCPLNSNEEDCFEWEIDLTDKYYTGHHYSVQRDNSLHYTGQVTYTSPTTSGRCLFPYGPGMKKIGPCGAKPATFENHLPEEFGGDGLYPGSTFYIWIDGEDEIEFTIDCPWSSHYINKLIVADHLSRTPWMDGCWLDFMGHAGTGCSQGSPHHSNQHHSCSDYGYCDAPATATDKQSLDPNGHQWSFYAAPYFPFAGSWKCKPSKKWGDEEFPWINAVQFNAANHMCKRTVHPDFNFDSDCSEYRSWESFQAGKIQGGYTCSPDDVYGVPISNEVGFGVLAEDCQKWTRDESLDEQPEGLPCRYYESHSPDMCCGCRMAYFSTPPYYCNDQMCEFDDYACSLDWPDGDTTDVAGYATGRCRNNPN